MPTQAPRICSCGRVVQSGETCPCRATQRREADALRPSARQRGYGSRWQAARLLYLFDHPLCARCLADDVVTPATDVDHIIPHAGNQTMFWDERNWQALCHSCHSKKTNGENGGFGRPTTYHR